MGFFGNLIKGGMTHEQHAAFEVIEKMLARGEISHQEAERRRADLEATLHEAFGEEKEHDEA